MRVSDITVDYLDHMGSDLTVVNAARVSMDKWHESFAGIRDTSLIEYLAEHNHWSPFAHAFLQIRVKAPIFVERQLFKHTVGLVANSVSRRYVDSEPEFYVPELRKRAENVKQGSSSEVVISVKDEDGFELDGQGVLKRMFALSLQCYETLLKSGVAPEIARSVLPQSMMTEWVWSGSLYAFARVCNLRLDSHAQKETRLVAGQIFKMLERYFPVSTKALINVGD